ncbi:MAG: DUF397 domain-containing protein [Kibdelosporangium sp.]
MTTPRGWRKSSFSGDEINCVELAGGLDAIRDSKNPAVHLVIARASVEALVASTKARPTTDR